MTNPFLQNLSRLHCEKNIEIFDPYLLGASRSSDGGACGIGDAFGAGTETGAGEAGVNAAAADSTGAGGKFGLVAPLGRLFRHGRFRRRRRRDRCVLKLAGKAHWAVAAVLQQWSSPFSPRIRSFSTPFRPSSPLFQRYSANGSGWKKPLKFLETSFARKGAAAPNSRCTMVFTITQWLYEMERAGQPASKLPEYLIQT